VDEAWQTCQTSISTAFRTDANMELPLFLKVDIRGLSVAVSSTDGGSTVAASATITSYMQWRDERLYDPKSNPCLAVMSTALSQRPRDAVSATLTASKLVKLGPYGLDDLGDVSLPAQAAVREHFTIALNPSPEEQTLEDAADTDWVARRASGVRAEDFFLTSNRTVVQYELAQRVNVLQRYIINQHVNNVPVNATRAVDHRFSVGRELAAPSAVLSGRRLASARARGGSTTPSGRTSPASIGTSGSWDFFFHPFDNHVLMFEVQTAGFHATTCGTQQVWYDMDSITNGLVGEWKRDGSPWSETTAHGCSLFIPIARRRIAEVLNQLIPHALVSLASLFSMFLDPISADTAAGRVSVLFVATLLLVESAASQRFSSPALLWVDCFNLLSVGVTTLAVFETFTVHALAHYCGVTITGFERVCRVAFPSFYLLLATSLLVWAADKQHSITAMVWIQLFTALLGMVAVGYVWFDHKRRKRQRRCVLQRLAKADPEDTETAHIMQEVLRLYDSDNSGTFTHSELKIFLGAIYPHLEADGLCKLMDSVGWRSELNVKVSPNDFQAMLLAWQDGHLVDEESMATSTAFRPARMKAVPTFRRVVSIPSVHRYAEGVTEAAEVEVDATEEELQSALLTTASAEGVTEAAEEEVDATEKKLQSALLTTSTNSPAPLARQSCSKCHISACPTVLAAARKKRRRKKLSKMLTTASAEGMSEAAEEEVDTTEE